tara:strand:- start:2495 stop:2632 length:138 start_codon:yes stop_codon:yes gene_type:complete
MKKIIIIFLFFFLNTLAVKAANDVTARFESNQLLQESTIYIFCGK